MSGDTREFLLPDLGEGLEGAEIVRWLVQVGDTVVIDQPVVEVETAKAQVEVPCPYAGTVAARFGEEGTELPVGAPLIAVTAPAGTAAAAGTAASGGPADGGDPQPGGGSGQVLVGYGTTDGAAATSSARARRRQRARGATTGAAPAARPVPAGPQPAPAAPPMPRPGPATGPLPVISPLVRRQAREHGLDLRTIAGSGPDGLILRADVNRAIAAAHPGNTRQDQRPAAPHGTASAAANGTDRHTAVGTLRIPLKGIAAVAADRVSRSRREIPEATCWVDADATELLAARRDMGEPRVSVTALLARITTAALARFPQLNATVDTEAGEIVRMSDIHLGFAAQTERGLVVPVIRDAHTLSTRRLHQEAARLTDLARAGRLAPGQLTGSTFTLNNYGVFGVDGSTPIINYPEAGMLGVGRIISRPWAHRGELALRDVVQLSLTFDHRVCDGGVAGGFLRYVADCVERPVKLLGDL